MYIVRIGQGMHHRQMFSLDVLNRKYRIVVYTGRSAIPPCCCGHLRQLFLNHNYSAGGVVDTEEKGKEYRSLFARSHRCLSDDCRLEKGFSYFLSQPLLFFVS